MKRNLLLLASLALFGTTAHAQWVNQPITFNNPAYLNIGISAVDANVAWSTVLEIEEGATPFFSRTINGGSTWTTTAIPGLAANEVVTSLQAQSATTAWVTVANSSSGGGGRVLRTTDGGVTWTALTNATQFANVNSYPTLLHFFDANNGVVVGAEVNGSFEIYTTANGGTTWVAVPSANIPALTSFEDIEKDFPIMARTGNNIWFGTDEGRIFRSTNLGLTWTVATTGLDYLEAIAFRDASNGLAMDDDNNYVRTTDGGTTWTQIFPTGPVHVIGLDNVPGTRTYVSTGFGGNGPGSSYSTDDGQTWTAIESTVNHALVDFVSPTVGWSGGVVLDAFGDAVGGNGMNKYTGVALATNKGLALRLGVSSYPNPSADGKFLIEAKSLKTIATARVLDELGRTVLQQEWRSPQTAPLQLDLGGRPAGVYVLELNTTEGPVRQKLVVK
jgi:photosystem II stability/assembly factor-like uncharacterized protein